MKRFFVIAGEASGDALGAAMMAGMRELVPGVEFHGVGGAGMQAQGLTSLFPMEELSVMGLAEVLPKYPHLVRRKNECADAVLRMQPDALITIDSPDFCLRVAKRVRQASKIRTVHYVAPTVWAWRPGRAAKMAQWIDQVLALLPFEPPYMEAEGMRCDFVGHPISVQPQASAGDVAAFRAAQGLGDDTPLILGLPGSRRSEVERLMPIFGETLHRVLKGQPKARVMIPAAPSVFATVQRMVADWPAETQVLNPAEVPQADRDMFKRTVFAAADLALAASGTVSLELAAAGTPMIIGYDMSWLSRQIIGRMVKTETVTLVNLVTGTRTVPEFLGTRCRPDEMSAEMLRILQDPHLQSAQKDAAASAMQLLGQGGEAPGLRAARAILEGLE